jgi:hypothetical protein
MNWQLENMQKIKNIYTDSKVYTDLKAGQHFYNARQSGVGDYFYDNLIADMHSLILYAGVHQQEDELYRMPARRFPYFIYYLIENHEHALPYLK